jgi:hypothetical protein
MLKLIRRVTCFALADTLFVVGLVLLLTTFLYPATSHPFIITMASMFVCIGGWWLWTDFIAPPGADAGLDSQLNQIGPRLFQACPTIQQEAQEWALLEPITLDMKVSADGQVHLLD